MKKKITMMLFLVLPGIVSYCQDRAAQFDKELKEQQAKGVLRIEGNKLIFKTNYPIDSVYYVKKYQPWINELQSSYTMAFEPKHADLFPPGPPSNRVVKTGNGTVVSPRDPAIVSSADSAIIGPVDSRGKLAPPPPGKRKLAPPPPGIKGNRIARDSSVGAYNKLAPPPPGNRKLAPPPPGLKNVITAGDSSAAGRRDNSHSNTLKEIKR